MRTSALVAALLVAGLAATPSPVAAASGHTGSSTSQPELLVRAGGSATVYVETVCQGAPCSPELWRTRAGAATLARVTMPPFDPATQILVSLVFATPTIGVAVIRSTLGRGAGPVASLYLTTDGASHWRAVPIGANRAVLAITTTASSVDLVTARCLTGPIACTAVRFQRTAIPAWHLSSVRLANQRGLGSFGATIAAFGQHVWISESGIRGAPLLATSTDGGASFTIRKVPALVAVSTCALTATSRTALWASCQTGMLVSLVRSTDAGATWTALEARHSVAGTDGHAFDPVDGDLAYLHLTYPGPLLIRVSGPAGAVTRVGPGPFAMTPTLVFVNRLDGFALGEAAGGTALHLAATSDGGAQWHQLTIG